jgi:hypothetical protein
LIGGPPRQPREHLDDDHAITAARTWAGQHPCDSPSSKTRCWHRRLQRGGGSRWQHDACTGRDTQHRRESANRRFAVAPSGAMKRLNVLLSANPACVSKNFNWPGPAHLLGSPASAPSPQPLLTARISRMRPYFIDKTCEQGRSIVPSPRESERHGRVQVDHGPRARRQRFEDTASAHFRVPIRRPSPSRRDLGSSAR